jgi:hypothetical protein
VVDVSNNREIPDESAVHLLPRFYQVEASQTG